MRADGSQLAPSLVDIDNVNPFRKLTGSLRLVARGDKPTSRKGSGVQKETVEATASPRLLNPTNLTE